MAHLFTPETLELIGLTVIVAIIAALIVATLWDHDPDAPLPCGGCDSASCIHCNPF